ncbi:NERD domain-containing protein [Lysobacter sp. A6]|uniref:NERD domain-containing protein n=1 Tax=Noviluteimonas lactosilytica TaxID=2888523 RepID=A0ABS8JEC8_9GAMM|nr:nuclease-related domain-containing protein [Lysobacter lactosilyticus]MCC8361900.1 NERD domain-containing protein [Lysobacter lactosilyticus]
MTFKVINLPGEGLRKSIARHDEAFDETLTLIVVVGPITLAAWLATIQQIDWGSVRLGLGEVVIVVGLAIFLGITSARLFRHAAARRRYKEGLAAELAVAQALMPLMADGLSVFHDFPAEGFNIDHVVIGRSAVFSVETKARKKPPERGSAAARVRYDGRRLEFPSHSETRPLEQALAQARWLEKFLSSGVGEPVRVIPVLALPGWYVEQTVPRPEIVVNNCHNPRLMASRNFGDELSESKRKRIAHVLVERYPNVVAED